MIELGKKQTLLVVKSVEFGVFAGFGCHVLSLSSKQIVFRYKKITLREQGRKQFAQGINEL